MTPNVRPRGRPRRPHPRQVRRLTVRVPPELQARIEAAVTARQIVDRKYSLNDWCCEAFTAAVEAEEGE